MSHVGGGKGLTFGSDLPFVNDTDSLDHVPLDPTRRTRPEPSEVSYEEHQAEETGNIDISGNNHWYLAQVYMKVEDLNIENSDYSKCENPEKLQAYLAQLSTLLLFAALDKLQVKKVFWMIDPKFVFTSRCVADD